MYRSKLYQILITLFFLLALTKSQGQDLIRFQNLTVSDGLTMGTITAFQKDKFGYIWIATAEGLHRFDGKHFRVFKHKDRDDNSLSDSYIRCLLAVDDKLYIGNNSGVIDVLNLNDYSFKHLRPTSVDPKFDYPISVLSQFEGSILIGTEGGGLWYHNSQNNTISPYKLDEKRFTFVNDIKTSGESFYLSSERYLYQCSFKDCKKILETDELNIAAFDFLNEDIILGTSYGLLKWNSENGFEKIELPPRKRRVYSISDILVDGNNFWVSSMGGLLHYVDGQYHFYEHDPIRPFSLVNNQINTIYKDDEGIIWLGTLAGVSRYAPKLKKFGLLQYFDYQNVNYNNNVYYIYSSSDGFTYLGTLTGGLIKLNAQHQIEDVYPIIKDGAIETKAVRAMFEDSKGNCWIGTRDEGLFLFDKAARKFKHIKGSQGFEISSKIIRCIYEDSENRLWIGTQQGLNLYNIEENKFYSFVAEPEIVANNSIYQITEDPKTKQLIIASFRGGLQFFNPNSKRFISLKYHKDDSTSISNNNVMCLEWMNEDTLLIGTYGGGLNIIDVRSKKALHINEDNGLINNAVYGIIYQGDGKIWLSTNNGVVLYNLYLNTFTNFKPVHYLQNTEFNEGAFERSANGYYYFGGVSGFNYFKPEAIVYDTLAPKLRITDIRGDYQISENGTINLSFINSRLELDFMALYYVNPQGVQYKYKLEGYDHDWVVPLHSNTASYPRLSPGTYTFTVVAQDEFGKWVSTSDELKVYVKPPFWQMWWFILLLIGVVAGAVFLLFRYRTREIEKAYKHQLVDSELRALRSQMNPHFIFNSLNSIQYFILKKQPQEAYTYLSKFASLMRKILQNSRLKYISIKDEVEWLELYLEMEKLRMDNNLEYTIDYEGVEDIEGTYIPTMLIQPYVENGIIHGLLSKENDRQIAIKFTKKEDHIVCIVHDNGIGRDAARVLNEKRTRKHDSAGMALTKTRLKILSEGKGDFDVQIEDLSEEGLPIGTKVTILIPLIEKVDE